ncbi:hypothetical protein GE107_20330 [Cohnella sp. CFH 77786]|uniref:hypothetical protein n=1 Tax=Cohnella sp. CFH 77786 TaxID=2662265 RepID=UPI001C6102A0|nr:hypothetical protein [Cohnella sp. CFH 77786]MBW5448395.1 hypothetical protein [Cohnella sp. CFH 77786]
MEQFYCVKCGQLAGIDRALTVFRTGYFRNEHHLGFCRACAFDRDRTCRDDSPVPEAEHPPAASAFL